MNEQKKILQLYPELEVGGATNILLSIHDILNKKYLNFIVSKKNKNLNINFKDHFFDFDIKNKSSFIIRAITYIKYIFFVYRIINKNKINFIINHHRYLCPATYILSKLIKIKVVFYAHSNPSKLFFFNKKMFGDNIISVSDGVKNTLIKNYDIKSELIFRIFNGIKTFKSYSEEEIINLKNKLKTKNKVFCCIAHFRPLKRQIFILKAYKMILRKNLDSTLILHGYGNYKTEIIDFIKKNKMNDNVKITSNKQYSSEDILNISNFSILASEREGLPLAIIESFSLGKPVIGTDIPGINEIITNNNNGLLFEKKSISSLSSSINLFLNNKNYINKLSVNSFRSFNKNFNFFVFTKNINSYFKK